MCSRSKEATYYVCVCVDGPVAPPTVPISALPLHIQGCVGGVSGVFFYFVVFACEAL